MFPMTSLSGDIITFKIFLLELLSELDDLLIVIITHKRRLTDFEVTVGLTLNSLNIIWSPMSSL